VLLDANVTAAYYLAACHQSSRMKARISNLFDSVRSGKADIFLYLPNFCVAEVFSVFMKYRFGRWNRRVVKHTRLLKHTVYKKLVEQFESDIKNGRFIYHYELSRYHVLGINLVAPINHYFQIKRKQNVLPPAGTFDDLIISMGIHLARIHGHDRVAVVTADRRLSDVLTKCQSSIPASTLKKLRMDFAETRTGIQFQPDIFPECVNLATDTNTHLQKVFSTWPLPVGPLPEPVYRR